MASTVPNIVLNNGYKMPILGLGTWKSKAGEVEEAVKIAIDNGYRHLDCAFAYGNEKEVGNAIQEKISEGVVKREDLFIVSKLWNTFHSRHLVEPALKESLASLKTDYLDLYLIHWPVAYQEGGEIFPRDENGKLIYQVVDYLDTWKAMEECVNKGLIHSIGVSNFNSQQLQRIFDNCTIKPAVVQVECHPYLNQKKLIQFCTERDVQVTAYSPLGSPDRPWAKPGDPCLLDDPKLKTIADKHGKSVAQILIAYQIKRSVAVIPKSVTKSRIIENIDVFDVNISEDDMDYIDSLDCNGRFCHLQWINDHPDYPFHTEF